jgi:16S rRNA (cytidine1402-2'-O)-methyltransferase
MTKESPALYVVPTPLGNLSDMTPRAVETLRRVPWVACEDTRHSAPLLRHFGVSARLLAVHEHNEATAAQRLVAHLDAGESVAFICDAGTPAISDPGARLVARVREAGHRVVPLPGPCAAVTALSAAGFAGSSFLFYGFLPAKARQREEALRELAGLRHTLVFYEAPHRIVDAVSSMLTVFGGERMLALARELSKLFETIHVCPLGDAPVWLAEEANRRRGEFVLIVSGALPPTEGENVEGARVLKLLLDEGLPLKQATRLAHAITGAPKNALYAMEIKARGEEEIFP